MQPVYRVLFKSSSDQSNIFLKNLPQLWYEIHNLSYILFEVLVCRINIVFRETTVYQVFVLCNNIVLKF